MNQLSLAADWPWLLTGVVGVVLFVVFEAKGLAHGARTHSLSRFMALIGAKFPLSLVLFGMLIGGLSVHFWWHWGCDITSQGG